MPARDPLPAARSETPYRQHDGVVAHRLRFDQRLRTYRAAGTPDWLLMVTVAGSGRIDHARGSTIVTAGECLLYAPRTPHDFGNLVDVSDPDMPGGNAGSVADLRWEVLWSHFLPSANWAEWLRWPELAPGLHHARADGEQLREIVVVMEKLMRRAQDPRGASRDDSGDAPGSAPRAHPRAAALAANALEEALLLCDALDPRGPGARIDARVRAAMAFMAEEIGRPLRLGEIARASGLSVSRLAHLFSDQVGTPIQDWLETQRIERACQRLALTTEPVSAIGASLGFPNAFYFSRRFAKRTGLSPRAYRQQGRQGGAP